MATISLSDLAPSGETVDFSFAGVEFSLTGSEGYESNDTTLLGAAEAHPWLKVKRDAATVIGGTYVEQISPDEDGLSAQNSIAFDVDEIRKVEEAKRVARGVVTPPKTEKATAKPVAEPKPVEKPAATKTAQETK